MPIAYFMIFGHICSPLLVDIGIKDGSFWSSHAFCCIVLGVLLYYSVIQKSISEMKIAGIILFAGIIMFGLILFIKLVSGKNKAVLKEQNMWKPDFGDYTMWANLPTIFLSYAFQTTYFPVYASLKVKTDKNGYIASLIAIGSVFLIYIIIAIVAIISFGDKIESDIMINISNGENTDYFDYILMGMFMLISAMNIPITFFIGKEATLIIVDEAMRKTISKAQENELESLRGSEDTPHAHGNIDNAIRQSLAAQEGAIVGEKKDNELPAYLSMSPVLYYTISTCLYALVVLLACVLPDISLVFGLIGSTAVSFIVFFGPAGYLLKGAQIEGVQLSF